MAKVVKDYARIKRTRKKQKKQRSPFSDVLYRFFALVFAAALAISYISAYIDPTRFHLPMYFGLYFIPLVLINFLMLAIGIIRKKASLLIPLIAILPTLVISDRFFKIGKEHTDRTGDHIKVLTYNLGRYSSSSRKISREEAIKEIRGVLNAEKADIVCLQEFSIDDTTQLSRYLPEYPYHTFHFFKGRRFFGNITLSRHPIAETEVIKFPKSTNLAIASDIKVGNRMVRIYNCHLESYSLSFTSIIKKISKRDTFQEEFNYVHEKLREANLKRSQQVKTVLESEEASCCPTIVCGDFNDMPLSYTYHKLTTSKKDSFVESGEGFSATYSVLWPLMRIDYILIPGEYGSDKHTIKKIPYSDHYPVTTNIYFE